MKPICVPCRRFYRPSRNGRAFVEGMPAPGHQDAKPGLREPDAWEPYKLWQGDEWTCPDCHAVIIVGVNWMPISEHYRPGFPEQVVAFGADLQINDC